WHRDSNPAPAGARPGSAGDRAEDDCVAAARREQLRPFVAPAALLFRVAPSTPAPSTFDLSPANRIRIAQVTGLVPLVTALGTVAAGVGLVRPLHALIRATRQAPDGDGAARVKVTGRDEIALLATVFNDMSQRRARLEELRRDMVSDVAHELRSPVS